MPFGDLYASGSSTYFVTDRKVIGHNFFKRPVYVHPTFSEEDPSKFSIRKRRGRFEFTTKSTTDWLPAISCYGLHKRGDSCLIAAQQTKTGLVFRGFRGDQWKGYQVFEAKAVDLDPFLKAGIEVRVFWALGMSHRKLYKRPSFRAKFESIQSIDGTDPETKVTLPDAVDYKIMQRKGDWILVARENWGYGVGGIKGQVSGWLPIYDKNSFLTVWPTHPHLIKLNR